MNSSAFEFGDSHCAGGRGGGLNQPKFAPAFSYSSYAKKVGEVFAKTNGGQTFINNTRTLKIIILQKKSRVPVLGLF